VNLRVVRNMLVLAATASPKMRARGRHALRRGFHNAFQTPTDEFLFPRGRRNAHDLPGKDQWHEHGLAFMVCKSVTAVHELFNSNFHSESLSVAGGAIFGRGLRSGRTDSSGVDYIAPRAASADIAVPVAKVAPRSSFAGTAPVDGPSRAGFQP
jgi:hypothetical protein